MKKYRLKNILSHLSIPVFSISILSCATKINDDSQNNLAPKTDEKKEEYILEKVEIAKGNNNSFNFKLKIKNSNNSILKKELIDIFYIKENEKNVQKQVLNNSIVESKLNDNILEFSIEELEVNTIYLLSEIKINEKNLILKNHDLTFKIKKEILKVEYFSLEEKRDDIKKLLFRFNINEFTNELIVLKLENVRTKEEIEIKSLIKDDKTALFELDSLLSSDAKELKIVDLYLDKKTEKIIINSKILDYKFTTSTIKEEKIIENDNFVIENIVISDIEKTSAKLILSFSHHDLKNESNKTFKIILKEKGSEITREIVYNDYVSKTNLIEIMLPDLKVGTNYIIDEIKLNDNNLNIETKERNFRTKDREIEEFSSLELVKDKSNKSNFILAKFDNSIEGNLEDYKFVLSIASKNNLNNIIEISNKIYNPENKGFVFELPNNIKKNNVYLVASIKNKLKNISFNEFEFELTRENYTFIKPKQLVNTNLTRQGNISNPKEIFDFETFPKNVVLEKNQNNETIVKRYFSDSISKLTQEIQGNSSFATEFPKMQIEVHQ
ncbi:hypothetical protein NX772_02440 [Mesomycoplasma molare]|uniref:Lipoprotein n=1 Tax=Mesomycoplasma molare TaxID=171288 RepID=A0ABY5TTE6_9BACT|nr:hypothetical protein [Mesomycoplasma molare]UWD33943.1 hypothetical protein NX772_02440 [Mesomycoplasma molare]